MLANPRKEAPLSKTCSRCKQAKALNDFNKRIRSKDGIQCWCRECHKVRYVVDPERACGLSRKWASENRQRKREAQRLWRIANAEKLKERERKRAAMARATPKGKVVDAIRRNVHRCLHTSGGKQGSGTFGLLGYTVDDLMAALEAKFKPGMSWSNHGEWHIDHIRPVASFNFISANDPEFQECWALENLQPLWAKENLSKGARYEG